MSPTPDAGPRFVVMSEEQINPVRADHEVNPETGVPGTAEGHPTDGVEIDEAEVDEAVTPDDNAFEVDGPQAGHA